MFFGQRAHDRDLIISPFHRPRAGFAEQLRLDPDREKLCVQAAGLRAYGVKMAVVEFLLQVNLLVQQPLRGVGVHVDSDGALVD